MHSILQTLVVVLALLTLTGCATLNYEGQTQPQSRDEGTQFGGWSPAQPPRVPVIRF